MSPHNAILQSINDNGFHIKIRIDRIYFMINNEIYTFYSLSIYVILWNTFVMKGINFEFSFIAQIMNPYKTDEHYLYLMLRQRGFHWVGDQRTF